MSIHFGSSLPILGGFWSPKDLVLNEMSKQFLIFSIEVPFGLGW